MAESYEAQGKFLQAGLQYRALLQTMPPDEEALWAWLAMLRRHGKQQEAQKCYQDVKGFVEAQGFTLSHAIEKQAKGLQDTVVEQTFDHAVLSIFTRDMLIDARPSLELLTWTDNDVFSRLSTVLSQPSHVNKGEMEITYFDQQTRLYWRAREETALPTVALYNAVVRHIDNLTLFLAHPHLPTQRLHLCETVCRTVLLAGILLYDQGQYAKARQQYQVAFQAAIEANNLVLQAIVKR